MAQSLTAPGALPSPKREAVGLASGIAAVVLGLAFAWLAFQLSTSAAIAAILVGILGPLLTLCWARFPMAFLAAMGLLLALNGFAVLIENVLVYRGVAVFAALLMALRFARVNERALLPFSLLLLGVVFGTLVSAGLHFSMRTLAFAGMWLAPFAVFYAGFALERDWGERFHAALGVIAASVAVISVAVYFGEWAEQGFRLTSYSIRGPYLNTNSSSAMLALVFPLLLLMAREGPAAARLTGLGLSSATVLGLVILVSRFALSQAILLPVLLLTRGNRLILVLLAVGLTIGTLYSIEMLPGQNPEAAREALVSETVQQYRFAGHASDVSRPMGYAVAYAGVQREPVAGIGLGASRDYMVSRGLNMYGADNFLLQTWLEGGLILLAPVLLLWAYLTVGLLAPVFFQRRYFSDLRLYAYALVALAVVTFDCINLAQYLIPLRTLFMLILGAILARRLAIDTPQSTVDPT